MRIEVLGTGCAKCDRLEEAARAVADRLKIVYEMHHVRDINEIVKRGVMVTPALVVNGNVVVAGRVPSDAELTTMLTSTLN